MNNNINNFDSKKDQYKCLIIKNIIQEKTSINDIGIRSRKPNIIALKQLYCQLCNNLTKASFTSIGYVLGNYSHATVIHSLKTYRNLKDIKGLLFPKLYDQIINKIINSEEKEKEEEKEEENFIKDHSINLINTLLNLDTYFLDENEALEVINNHIIKIFKILQSNKEEKKPTVQIGLDLFFGNKHIVKDCKGKKQPL